MPRKTNGKSLVRQIPQDLQLPEVINTNRALAFLGLTWTQWANYLQAAKREKGPGRRPGRRPFPKPTNGKGLYSKEAEWSTVDIIRISEDIMDHNRFRSWSGVKTRFLSAEQG